MNDCIIYVATKMSNRDRVEMIERAHYVCETLERYGLTPISPILVENVENKPGKLTQTSEEQLKQFWTRDKDIIAYEAHVVLCDNAQHKSYGVEREYGFARFCLWKPTVSIVPPDSGFIVSTFEDDLVVNSVEAAARLIARHWGTPWKRRLWRFQMLRRTLGKFLWRQLCQWR